ncbi:MAG TPA: hypothetical protein QGF05_10640 [Dehalococcoidia bacterium]|nr:hypothetical protein [Dehalococcoidia bacterium]
MVTKTVSKAKRTPRKPGAASAAGEKSREATAARRQAHEHHWLIEAPNGPVSAGKCKLCGKLRKFPNSSEDSIWDGADGRSRWNDMGISRRRKSQDDPIAEPNVVTV